MKYLVVLLAILVLSSCSSNEKSEKALEFKTFKDKISYALGADHARAIAESGDPNFDKYLIEEIVSGFNIGVKDENAFDKSCQETIKKMFGQNGKEFNASFNKEGSNCIGKLSGMFFMNGWKQKKAFDKIDLKMVAIGFEHSLRKIDTLIPRAEQGNMIKDFITDMNKLNGNKMLANAKSLKNTITTNSGIVIETIQEGNGGNPAPGDDVLAHYILMNANGDTLQDSYKMVEMYKQELTPFSLLAVVPGWQEGIPMMKKGGKYRLYLPYHLAYGEQGMFNPQSNSYDIQPYESLVFYIDLLNYGKPGSLTKK
jgi:FKBP-type peptidyl-prolyl cis-trans isomerase FkpA